MRIGLFCGTFNPIHHGHLLIAEAARQQFALSKVLFITSPHPPHRNSGLLDAVDRHELVAAAVAKNEFFEASTIELDREGPSYTVDTLRELRKFYSSEVQFDLILGGDNIKFVGKWHDVDELFSLCRLLIAPRIIYEHKEATVAVGTDGSTQAVLQTIGQCREGEHFELPGAHLEVIDFPQVAISSSAIRARLKDGKSVRYMVPEAVNKILLERGHFKE